VSHRIQGIGTSDERILCHLCRIGAEVIIGTVEIIIARADRRGEQRAVEARLTTGDCHIARINNKTQSGIKAARIRSLEPGKVDVQVLAGIHSCRTIEDAYIFFGICKIFINDDHIPSTVNPLACSRLNISYSIGAVTPTIRLHQVSDVGKGNIRICSAPFCQTIIERGCGDCGIPTCRPTKEQLVI